MIDSWLLAGDVNRHSEQTLTTRRERLRLFLWFLKNRELEYCGVKELRLFFQYVAHGHKEPGGRWGNPRLTSPTSPGRSKAFHSTLRTFFRWLVDEGEIEASPMERIPPPVDRPDQVQPFSDDQLRALVAAAKKSKINPRRDEAIILLLLDTGCRVSELCGLTCGDVNLHAGQILIREGKGGKSRSVPFSRETKRALYHYLDQRGADWGSRPEEPVFLAEFGLAAGEGLTRNGILQLIRRLGTAAKIEGVRCSPHTFRHSFAISFLRAGGNIFTLKTILGHESLAMTNRYVQIAQADVSNQHRMYSPVSRLGKKE